MIGTSGNLIYFNMIENAEIRYNWDFISLKRLKLGKSWEFFLLKMLPKPYYFTYHTFDLIQRLL